MEDVFLVDVYVHRLVVRQRLFVDEILHRVDFVVDVMLGALDVAREAAHAVVDGDDVGLELVDQIVQRAQRRNLAAGRDVDIGAERGDAIVRVRLRVGVHGNVALVEMRHHRLFNRCFEVEVCLRVAALGRHS